MTPQRGLIELNLAFPDRDHVQATLAGTSTGVLPFASPITSADRRDRRWYVETYGLHSLGDPDDAEARRIADLLPLWGRRLFDAVFQDRTALRLFHRFQDVRDRDRLLTITAEHPAILAIPWELLHDSSPNGGFLFHDNPRISIRRTVAGVTDGMEPLACEAKQRLHLLFVISRPEGAGFLDPRADPKAVLDALEASAPGRVTWEFLRPPTLESLVERLEDGSRPAVDVVHFDGHGVFDRTGALLARIAEARSDRRAPAAPGGAAAGENPGPPNTGYLLFETSEGEIDPVSADMLGRNLHRHRVALVILSACQSAAVAEQDEAAKPDQAAEGEVQRPMGSVAVRLTGTGIPAVLAMTHAVLVQTTRALFGAFYRDLARQRRVGEALDNARRHLWNHPERYEVQRGSTRVALRLYDWFLPALYQSGDDVPLLAAPPLDQVAAAVPARTNLRPPPEEGFFGRRREIWLIERWFTGKSRRITITGFGGQGKTALAMEAAAWLVRSGLFAAAVLVDYSRIQALDAAAVAVSHIAATLGESLLDAAAAAAALRRTPTLVILDNLEALAPAALADLLDAAVGWSEVGGSRVLCTTRRPDLAHPKYRNQGTLLHRRLALTGLGSRRSPDDALEWFAELSKLPPAPVVPRPSRDDLVDLFEVVQFHPLSLRVLAQQLKLRPVHHLAARLDELVAAPLPDAQATDEDAPLGLAASITLSLDRLEPTARALLLRLGAFRTGAFEDDLLAVTEIPPATWPPLRAELETAALLEAESVSGVMPPYLRFHPTLAPLLRAGLSGDEQARLGAAHRSRYRGVAMYIYNARSTQPLEAQSIAQRDLPNLLDAAYASLAAGEPDAVSAALGVAYFLSYFGLKREADALIAATQSVVRDEASYDGLLTAKAHGDQLVLSGDLHAAGKVYAEILERLGPEPTLSRATTLIDLGRCCGRSGHPARAVQYAHEALAVLDRLEPAVEVKRKRSTCLTDLGHWCLRLRELAEARRHYEAALRLDQELGDLAAQGASFGELGNLAAFEGRLDDAARHYHAAQGIFNTLGNQRSEAIAWHNLGLILRRQHDWDESERHLREAARMREDLGDLAEAAQSWSALAETSWKAGKLDAAEGWCRRALAELRQHDNALLVAAELDQLAGILEDRGKPAVEARRAAAEALELKRHLDPLMGQAWVSWQLLATAAEMEAAAAADEASRGALKAEAREHRRRAREARLAVPEAQRQLSKLADLVRAAAHAVDPARREAIEALLPRFESAGWRNLVAAIRRIVAGERDADALCEALDSEDAVVVETVLRGIRDPSSLRELFGTGEPAQAAP